jgi:hypothetical protein
MPLQHLYSENNSETLCGWLAAVQIEGRKLGEREREIMGAAAEYEFCSRNC